MPRRQSLHTGVARRRDERARRLDTDRVSASPTNAGGDMKRLAQSAWSNIGFVCVALVFIYCVVHAFDPPRLNWGDSMSDYNVMTSGRNFQKYGFLHLRYCEC